MSDFRSYEEELLLHGRILRTNKGVSMMPLIRENRDVMIIEKREGRLRKYDAPLYKRDGEYVVHRIIKVRDNSYDIIGDNCINIERGIKDEQIIGVLTGVIRNGKTITADSFKYKAYCHIWCDLLFVRIEILKLVSLLRAVMRKIKK